jgi:aspartyl-tRNA(Asn)/glutamyl-tRNA(Gln) amidotransferase subunit A
LVAYASSLDQISPFARTAADLAALLGIISGHDNHDSTTLTADVPDYLQACTQRLDGLRIGIIDELDGKGMDADVTKAFNATAEQLTQLGATVSHVMIPSIRTAIASYYIIATAEASSNLARFDGVRYGLRKEEGVTDILGMYKKTRSAGFGAEVKRRIMLGTFSLSSGYYDAYYNKAQKARQLLRQEFNAAFRNVDVLICPTSPTTAFKLGEKTADPVSMYLSDIATIPVNLVGIPAMNIPVGFDSQGLPIGVQLMGPHLSEMELFKVALAYENATGITNLVAPAMASVG